MCEKPILLSASHFGEREDDCACPEGAVWLNPELTDSSDTDCACASTIGEGHPADSYERPINSQRAHQLFTMAEGALAIPLPGSFVVAFSAYAPYGPCVLNRVAQERWYDFRHPRPLESAFDRLLAAHGLIRSIHTPPSRPGTSRETLTAWLHITNACNLDCPYCYVRKSSAAMSPTVGFQAIEAITRTALRHGFRRVKLKYAGGEATLHFALIRRLHDFACQRASEAGLMLEEVILSNGTTLRPKDADWLLSENIRLMISIDGIGELHNRLRALRGGGDTFARIEYVVDHILLPRGLRPSITMTVTGLNAGGAADVARWALIERDLPLSFNFYRRNPLSASRAELDLEEKQIIAGMLAAYAEIESFLPARPFLNGLLDRVQAGAHSHPCGAGLEYIVISHTGKVAQCHMLLEQPTHHDLTDDLMVAIREGPLQNLTADEKDGCRDCPFRFYCAGGCPLETYRATGRWDVKSPHCRIYQILFPAALRLEGLRLMKVHGFLHPARWC